MESEEIKCHPIIAPPATEDIGLLRDRYDVCFAPKHQGQNHCITERHDFFHAHKHEHVTNTMTAADSLQLSPPSPSLIPRPLD
jgi:hypothetical protein